MRKLLLACLCCAITYSLSPAAETNPADDSARTPDLAAKFAKPPDSAKPWVLWFWINGNVSKDGITKDLQAFKEVGVGGVLWMEVSGEQWPPAGAVKAYAPEWNDAFQWSIEECARLGLKFGMTLDFGYGCGGPHITPENSMQKLYWSETEVAGGQKICLTVPKPEVDKELVNLRLNPGEQLDAKVSEMIAGVDSYRDVAVLAIPLPASAKARAYRIPQLDIKAGLNNRVRERDKDKKPLPFSPEAATPLEKVVDLTDQMGAGGKLVWDAPAGQWLILRVGHASNYHMTRPCPAAAIGLEADRLSKSGIEAHFNAFLKPIIEQAGEHVGKTWSVIHHDSWEAGWQNWAAAFPEEFQKRRGYNPRAWLPVLTGRVIGTPDQSERFLSDLCRTASDLVQDNFNRRLVELVHPYGLKFSHESYGGLRVDYLPWAGIADIPMSEFWSRGNTLFPNLTGYAGGRKTATSIANLYGREIHAAEAFTSDRGWRDHPFLIKALGDKAFAEGINRLVLHCSAHQPYENAIPGLSHRKWGDHFTRFNTWWFYSQPWMDYLARCQYLMQQGPSVSDVLFWPGEILPPMAEDYRNPLYKVPVGYNYDVCPTEIFLRLKAENGRVVAPSGVSYAYLALPGVNRFSPALLAKVKELADAGARLVAGPQPVAAMGLAGYPESGRETARLGKELWASGKLITGKRIGEVFAADGLKPDFEGDGLAYLHRRSGGSDIYFVANLTEQSFERLCMFRIADKRPELWNPETGEIRFLSLFDVKDGRTTVSLPFSPMQSWFVVFREKGSVGIQNSAKNFPEWKTAMEIAGPWQVTFDPKWGGPAKPVTFDTLVDWSKHPDSAIRYYSGTAVYRTTFESKIQNSKSKISLDLGSVEVMARVRVNGKACGVAWKPPYAVDITAAARAGENAVEIDVVNLWINRMIGDEQLPEDAKWLNGETLAEWPEWMRAGQPRPSGRYTFTTIKHYDAASQVSLPPRLITKDSQPFPSGLLGPVTLILSVPPEKESR